MTRNIYQLNDNTSMTIAPEWGCNMFSWIVDGEELMYCPEDHPENAQKITGGGNPILFPSVGRTWDQSSGEPAPGNYVIYGIDKTFFMPSHGILFLSHFKKTGEDRSADEVTVTYDLEIPDRVREENYPFDLGFTQKFTLKATSVELEGTIVNRGNVPAPCAFGYHPYFAISNPMREGIEVRMPVTKQFILTPKTVMLTGEEVDSSGVFSLKPDLYYDFAYGKPIGTRMSLADPMAGHVIYVDFDPKCEVFFLYSPDGSEFVCIEPWSWGLGAFEQLKNPGWEDGKLIPVLGPGETVSYRAVFSVEKI